MGKDLALIPVEDGKYDYEWVDPADPRACEVKGIEVVKTVGASTRGPSIASRSRLHLSYREATASWYGVRPNSAGVRAFDAAFGALLPL